MAVSVNSLGVAAAQGEDSDEEAETDEAALASADSWEPDPIDADPSRSARSRRMHDIISMLVGIYGSKELFITEYRCNTQSSSCTTASCHSFEPKDSRPVHMVFPGWVHAQLGCTECLPCTRHQFGWVMCSMRWVQHCCSDSAAVLAARTVDNTCCCHKAICALKLRLKASTCCLIKPEELDTLSCVLQYAQLPASTVYWYGDQSPIQAVTVLQVCL